MMTKSILCPIDLSVSSRRAVEWAVTMARQLNVHLTILYIYRLVQTSSGEVVQLKRRIESDAHAYFLMMEKDLLLGKGITYDFKIEIGFVADRIEDHARRNSLDFLVMDRKISVHNSETFQEMIEHIRIPMLLLP